MMFYNNTTSDWIQHQPPSLPSPQIRCVHIVNLILDAIIFTSTSTFIYTFQCRRAFLFKKPSNKLMFSLTLADCFASLIAVSHVLQEILPAFYAMDCQMCIPVAIISDVLTTFLSMVYILHLIMLTFDRYISISRALRYNSLMNDNLVNKILFVVWLVPFAASGVQIVYLQPYIVGEAITVKKAEEIYNIEMVYSIASFILFTLLPCILILVAYVAMFVEIRKLLLKTPHFISNSKVSSKQLKLVHAFCMMYVCFMLFSVPFFTLRLMVDVTTWMQVPVNIPIFVFDATYVFKNFSLLCNSFIYLIMNKEFRYSFLKVICGRNANRNAMVRVRTEDSFKTKTTSTAL